MCLKVGQTWESDVEGGKPAEVRQGALRTSSECHAWAEALL